MSRENRRDVGPATEYDFSRAERGKYRRFAESAPRWVPVLANADVQGWVVRALVELQRLEAQLVAYRLLMLDEEMPVASGKVARALEDITGAGLESLLRDYALSRARMAKLHASLLGLLRERRWLIHYSFKDLERVASTKVAARSADRFARTWERAHGVGADLAKLLDRACAQKGMDASEARSRADQLIEDWARDRSAA